MSLGVTKQVLTLPIIPIALDWIKKGLKTIEVRKISKFKPVKIVANDMIMFVDATNKDNFVVCLVEKVIKYDSLDELLTKEKPEECIPNITTKEKALEIYKNIPGYDDPLLKMLAIKIKVLPLEVPNE